MFICMELMSAVFLWVCVAACPCCSCRRAVAGVGLSVILLLSGLV